MVWSYSRYSTYKQCPRKYKFAYLDKLPRLSTEVPAPVARGLEIHGSAEEFLLGNTEELHEVLEPYRDYFIQVRDIGCVPEQKWCLSNDWEIADWDDKDALIRGILDLHIPPNKYGHSILEFKTGKEYDEHVHQRHLYGVAGLILHPESEKVEVANVYFDQQRNVGTIYHRSMQRTAQIIWKEKLDRAAADETCIPNPSFKCKWCDYSKANGGPCQF